MSRNDEQIERNFYSILIHTKPSVKKEFALTVGIYYFIIRVFVFSLEV